MDINKALDILSRSIQCDDNEAHDALDVVRNAINDENEEEDKLYFGDHDDTMPGYTNPAEDN